MYLERLTLIYFTLHAANTPPPDGFQVSVSKGSTDEMLYLNILWDSEFNTAYEIESYQIEASNGFIDCPQMCSPRNDNPCQCSELRAGTNGNITITATSCGDLQGPPTVITITPEGRSKVFLCKHNCHIIALLRESLGCAL